ncbi:MAG: sigma-70 family RNA polymerase sigma factor [Thermosipho sp. (in: Bacteria)]|nr:sigma-70 family RNA polymerase sigma factor [Thermosipho sp. (in: thermotogales)]
MRMGYKRHKWTDSDLQKILYMRDIKKMKMRHIAKLYKCSEDTIRKRLKEARKKFRGDLYEKGGKRTSI